MNIQQLSARPVSFASNVSFKLDEDNIPVEDYRQLAQKFDWQDLILSIYYRSTQNIDNPTLKIKVFTHFLCQPPQEQLILEQLIIYGKLRSLHKDIVFGFMLMLLTEVSLD